VSGQKSITLPGAEGLSQIGEIMKGLRRSPPPRVGDLAVTAVRDYQARVRTSADGATTPIALPASNVLAYELDVGSRIIARPSGTEPKIKFYFDLREAMATGESVEVAEARARAKMEQLSRAFSAIAVPSSGADRA